MNLKKLICISTALFSVQLFSYSEKKPVKKWLQEVSENGSASFPLVDFKSSLYPTFHSFLGEPLLQSNVASVNIAKRKFTFIADRHLRKEFRDLLPAIIREVNHNTSLALFMEGLGRNSDDERVRYSGFLGEDPKLESFLFGIENEELFAITHLVGEALFLGNGSKKDANATGFLYEILFKNTQKKWWMGFTANLTGKKYKNLAVNIIRYADLFNNGVRNNSLLTKIKNTSVIQWKEMYQDLALYALSHQSVLDEDEMSLSVHAIQNPKHHELYESFIQKVNIAKRDHFILENLIKTIKTIPENVEILVFIGYLHLPSLVGGLMDSLEKDEVKKEL